MHSTVTSLLITDMVNGLFYSSRKTRSHIKFTHSNTDEEWCSAYGHLSPSYLYLLLEYRVKFIVLIGHKHFHLATADMRQAHFNKHGTTNMLFVVQHLF